jgi:hypothetical protein
LGSWALPRGHKSPPGSSKQGWRPAKFPGTGIAHEVRNEM